MRLRDGAPREPRAAVSLGGPARDQLLGALRQSRLRRADPCDQGPCALSHGAVTRDAKGEFLRENAITNLKFVRDDRDNPPRLLLPSDNPDHIDLWITNIYAGRSVAKAARSRTSSSSFSPRAAAVSRMQPADRPQRREGVTEALESCVQTARSRASTRLRKEIHAVGWAKGLADGAAVASSAHARDGVK